MCTLYLSPPAQMWCSEKIILVSQSSQHPALPFLKASASSVSPGIRGVGGAVGVGCDCNSWPCWVSRVSEWTLAVDMTTALGSLLLAEGFLALCDSNQIFFSHSQRELLMVFSLWKFKNPGKGGFQRPQPSQVGGLGPREVV